MEQTTIDEAAALLAANRSARGALDGLPKRCRPASQADGYAIQQALARILGAGALGPVAGLKIGCTTEVMQAYMKIGSPCAGTLLRGGVHDSPAAPRFDAYRRVGVECEIAVRLAAPLPDRADGAERIAGCVESCMAAIEIVDDRYRDFRDVGTPTLIADDFFHAGCVLGPPARDWRTLDLAALAGRMAVNGETVGTGRGSDILGHPLAALSWLAESGLAKARGLGAGSIVMLGSVVQTVWLSPGDRVAVEIEGLGRAEAAFA